MTDKFQSGADRQITASKLKIPEQAGRGLVNFIFIKNNTKAEKCQL